MLKPSFSVIIPTHNRLEFLKAALESVWQQTQQPWEVIVVDDGSTDGTHEWLASQRGRIRFVRQDNRGPGAARNRGAAQATGDFLAFLDSDDLWLPTALASYAEALDRHPEARLLLARVVEFTGPSPGLLPSDGRLLAKVYQNWLVAAFVDGRYVGGSTIAVRRETFTASGGFDETLRCAEDQDWGLRLGGDVVCVGISAPPQVAYRRHPASETGSLRQLLDGAGAVVTRERNGAYPSGDSWRRERRTAIMNLAIPISISSLSAYAGEAWSLYSALFPWCVAAGRWKYVFGFPVLAVRRLLIGAE